ncbi:MAG: transposase [Bacteroidales bacterium]|nr:transposase [Bacteroidales bacterium]
MGKIYLLSTDHLEKSLWFRDEEDFKVAMNYIAIQAAECPEVMVLAFILMSNHVHFVIRGPKEKVLEFIGRFKHRYSLYYQRKYGVSGFLRRNGVDIRPVPEDEPEALEKVIAYVQMNCVAANICAHPSGYRWWTGNAFFYQGAEGGRHVESLSMRAIKKLLHTEFTQLPKKWRICEEGYILPSSYIDVKMVESRFRTPKRMNYFLNNSSKARKKPETQAASFRDQTVLAALPDLCRSLFQKNDFTALDNAAKVECARQLRYRFGADAHQIARVCGISYTEAAALLDSV